MTPTQKTGPAPQPPRGGPAASEPPAAAADARQTVCRPDPGAAGGRADRAAAPAATAPAIKKTA